MKKLLLLFIMIIIFTGCTARYKLNINKDLTLDEEITGLESDDFYSMFHDSKRTVALLGIRSSEKYLESEGYSISDAYEKDLYGLTLSKKYLNFDEYKSSFKLYSFYYNSFSIDEDNGIYTISLIDKIIDDDFSNRYVVDDGEIIISLPFKVLESNADKVYKSSDGISYKWNFNLTEDKDIYIKFDSNVVNEDYGYIIFIVVVSVLLFAFGIFFYKYYVHKKNNKDAF